MGLVDLLLLLLIAAISGAVGQAIAGYSMGGCLVSTGVGFIGAWLGTFLAGATDLPAFFTLTVGGRTFPVVWAIIGAALFAFGVSLLTRRRR